VRESPSSSPNLRGMDAPSLNAPAPRRVMRLACARTAGLPRPTLRLAGIWREGRA